jgi:hypothetical protein
MSGLMAKYVAGDYQEELSRVATFDVGVSESLTKNLDITLTPQDTNPNEYTLQVENSGQVAVRVKATLYLRGNLPLAVSVQNQDEDNKEIAKIENTLDTKLQADPINLNWNIEIEANAENPVNEKILIGWSSVEGYDLSKFENGVEYVRLVLNTEQID